MGPRAGLWAELFLWLVPDPPRDEDAFRALAVTTTVAALMCAIGPLYAGLIWLFAPPPPVYYALAAGTFLACALALLLLRHRLQRVAAWLLLTAGPPARDTPVLRGARRPHAAMLEGGAPSNASAALFGIRPAASRGAELTRQLLLLSRKEDLAPTVLDLRTVIQDLQRLLQPVMPEGVRMEFEPPPEPVLILADPSQ